MKKKIVCCTPYLRNHASYDFHLWYTYVKWKYLWAIFFHFFKILIFQIVRWIKGQKMAQNHKKFYPLCLISQEPYIIWSSFMVHFYKTIISPGVFYIFLKFSGFYNYHKIATRDHVRAPKFWRTWHAWVNIKKAYIRCHTFFPSDFPNKFS